MLTIDRNCKEYSQTRFKNVHTYQRAVVAHFSLGQQ